MILGMNKEILIRLTPLEPYFLGSDRTFHYGEKDIRRIGKSDYFIKSEKIPSQTTLFGILRYLGIQDRTEDYDLGKNAQFVGASSFLFNDDRQTFGMIRSISPLFLMHHNTGKKLVRTPLNHCKTVTHRSESGNLSFYPFRKFTEVMITNGNICEEQFLPLDFNAKEWLTDSYMDISNGEIFESFKLFSEIESIGIDIKRRKDAFYKMQFVGLKEGYCFAFYAVVDDGFPEITDRVVYMGRRKSAFAVTVETAEESMWDDCSSAVKNAIGIEEYPFLYCASDTYLTQGEDGNPIERLLSHCRFSVIQTNTVREYRTNYKLDGPEIKQERRFEKSGELFRLIKAGSVLYPKDGQLEAVKNMVRNNHFETIGMNCIIEGGKS